ncbi:bifunctional sulfate adenylyltransferase/adenylylsulfate kinase [Pleionea sp. CnH1-48]|uniref:bifunctional sulfate adenylyltransferase/adenylylsulfate kinase n=1 Tax=Pleionea sp. CnH1-48 TaxID=2954494 RepID=UPI0020979633|nr:bifunctional sulfate adenylyltransferase/adenylylsulfate kinase [Pleionea sp. CnH1-48]MCO7223780.1 bifunctional sulfate adenylyltransferase/adenylylsulfate kinase [Pleionea sp. CnH1-48]
MTHLTAPHGGQLTELYVSESEQQQLKELATGLPSWDLTHRQLCDIELLLNGGFSPLTGFLSKEDYQSVLDSTRLADGTLWPIPVTLDVDAQFAETIQTGSSVALRDAEGVLLAVLEVSDIWTPDKTLEAQKVFGTDDQKHPAVDYLLNKAGEVYLGGRLKGVEAPNHYDYKGYRDTPAELRAKFKKWGWRKVVAFQTRNPMHRAHQELTFRAARQEEANLLIHPVVGMTKPGDIDHYSRVRCYEHIIKEYPEQTTMLSLLPLAMRMGGPREALWHAIIRKNYGCTHLIVGRDHAGPGKDSNGEDFYGPYDAQTLLQQHEEELGIQMVPFQMMVYVKEKAEYLPADEVEEGMTALNISGTEVRRRLAEGLEIPEWFSYPEVVKELRKTSPARDKQGVTIFFTGLSGAGKSTIANALMIKLLEMGNRPVTLLDGDIVRKHLSSELGFSKEHRNINILRIGYVASEITKNGGFAICAPIAPYQATRREVRAMIEPLGGFIEVHVATSLEECERRDRKGLYAKARAGLIKEFTGISDPYEVPEQAEITIDTLGLTPDEAAQEVILKLESEGYIR